MSDIETLPSDGGAETLAPETTAPEAQTTPDASGIGKTESALDAVRQAFKHYDKQPRAEDGKWTAEQQAKADAAKAAQPALAAPVVPKEGQPAAPVVATPAPVQAPTRFSKEAQDAWGQAPEIVRKEVERAFSEMTKGLTEYQQRWEPLKQFDAMAQQAGRPLADVVSNYVETERLLYQNPIAGFTELSKRLGIDPVQLGQALAGQQPTGGNSVEMTPLLDKIATLEKQLGGFQQTFEQQRMQQELNAWAADKPRFAEVREVMAQLVAANMASGLDEAYEKAVRLQPPAPSPASPAPQLAAQPTVPAQTRKPTLQITGSPSGASNAQGRKPPKSAREALSWAFAET